MVEKLSSSVERGSMGQRESHLAFVAAEGVMCSIIRVVPALAAIAFCLLSPSGASTPFLRELGSGQIM